MKLLKRLEAVSEAVARIFSVKRTSLKHSHTKRKDSLKTPAVYKEISLVS